jgi:hypothetical protein
VFLLVESLTIVHQCDHVIDSTTRKATTILASRATGQDYDIVCGPGTYLADIYNVYTENQSTGERTYYFENADFDRFTNDKLKWRVSDTSAKVPSDGETYMIDCITVKREIIQYPQDSCPRCNGNAWYVDLSNGRSMSKVTSMDKIVQDFMKLLLTDSEDNPGLDSMIGAEIKDAGGDIDEMVSFIKSCESRYMANQTEISRDVELQSDEILDKVVISDIEYDSGDNSYYIAIMLMSAAGQIYEVNLKK